MLRSLHEEVLIPAKVFDELTRLADFRKWFETEQPIWIEIRQISDQPLFAKLVQDLDEGESEAITLCLELHADLLLIDELAGRTLALKFGIPIIGVLGLLLEAKAKKLLPLVKPVIDRLLAETTFRIAPYLYQKVLGLAGE
ncbi:MAG: DUF3368 domain-containing protein [Cytophagaceae bacterium]|nr:DUF3368 domain-containing protein [Cytophagaceae bacterium]